MPPNPSNLINRPGVKIVDSHVHIWSKDDIPMIVNEARRLGIKRVCVSCLTDWDWSTVSDPGAGNALVFHAADGNPEVLGYVYVDPRFREKALEQVDSYLTHPAMIGIKQWISCPANDSCVHPVAERASEEGLIMLVHSWRRGTKLEKGHQTLPSQVAELASSFPEVPIIMAHLGGDWEGGVAEVADQGNVLADTSGSINEAGMIERAVEVLGGRRVVYGSDAPGSGYLPNLGKIVSAEISDRDKIMILGANMEKLISKRSGKGRIVRE